MFLPATKATDKTKLKPKKWHLVSLISCKYLKENVVVFLFFATLLGSVLQITNTFGVPFLQDIAQSPNADDSFFALSFSVLIYFTDFRSRIYSIPTTVIKTWRIKLSFYLVWLLGSYVSASLLGDYIIRSNRLIVINDCVWLCIRLL